MLHLCLAKAQFLPEYIKHVSKKMNNICNTEIVSELQICYSHMSFAVLLIVLNWKAPTGCVFSDQYKW